MNEQLLKNKVAGLEKWHDNFGQGMERRARDGASWYDLSINCNSIPCEPELAVIVTAWQGQLKWLKATLASYRRSGAFVILSYDNPFYAWAPTDHYDVLRCMPNMDHYLLANCFVSKHITYDCDKRNGWFWNVRYAQGVIKSFPNIKYIYCTNGDCALDNPEGLKEVIRVMGDHDIFSGQGSDDLVHTAAVMYKIDAFNKIFDYMFEMMRVPVIGAHSPEVMLREAISELKLKNLNALKQPLDPTDGTIDMYARYGQNSTWKEILGFRNLFAEYETAGNEGKALLQLAPYVDNFMDWLYFNGEERETICKYWETKDRRYLYMFWARWEDSDYNRWYAPIGWYGNEPIYDESNTSIYGRQK